MAPTLLYVFLTLAISVQATFGNNIDCENLNENSCAYAVSSIGKRCVLEKRLVGSGYTCRASEIMADNLYDWIETEECIGACGVDMKALGISSDSLLDRAFVESLCSEKCYRNCPNIVDLYFNLAAGEGVYLPAFCESKKRNNNGRHRDMLEFNSVASSPVGTPLDESATIEAEDALAPVTLDESATIEAEDASAPSPDGTNIDEYATFSANEASAPSPWGF